MLSKHFDWHYFGNDDGAFITVDVTMALCACLDQNIGANLMSFYTIIL